MSYKKNLFVYMSYKKKLCVYMSFNIKRHIYTSVISWCESASFARVAGLTRRSSLLDHFWPFTRFAHLNHVVKTNHRNVLYSNSPVRINHLLIKSEKPCTSWNIGEEWETLPLFWIWEHPFSFIQHIWIENSFESRVTSRFLLKTDSGYPRDAEVTLFTVQTLGVPFALTPIGQLHQSPPSPVPGDLGRCPSHQSHVTRT